MKKQWFTGRLTLINRLLLAAIILINGYLIFAPFVPRLTYKITQATSKPLDVNNSDGLASIRRDTNHLIIPRLRLDKPIFDGEDPNLVHRGIWHRPQTSTPDKGSNTVLVGHRFSYKDPAVFYNLDQVQKTDPIIAVWQGKLYIYQVDEIKVVPATAVDVEDASTHERLTLYTCTPLWSTEKRLVIVASLKEVK